MAFLNLKHMFGFILLMYGHLVYAKDTMVFAVNHSPPWSIIKQGEKVQGIDILLAEVIANKVGLEAKFLECPFSRCLRMLENGSADAILSLFKTTGRAKRIRFIEPNITLDSPKIFYLRHSDPTDIETYDQLSSLNVGVVRDMAYFERFDNDLGINKVPLVTDSQLIDMLVRGRLDTFIGTQGTTDYLASIAGKTRFLKKASYRFNSGRKSYLGISKQSALNTPHYIELFEKIIQQLKDQEAVMQISNKFLLEQLEKFERITND